MWRACDGDLSASFGDPSVVRRGGDKAAPAPPYGRLGESVARAAAVDADVTCRPAAGKDGEEYRPDALRRSDGMLCDAGQGLEGDDVRWGDTGDRDAGRVPKGDMLLRDDSAP